ncbi:hypothetical protein [Ferrimicrobium sp.]|uniref:hypothetical protein n=1 Tax=Ferrimicrobium sp. TaxID=2926050 RepID=UPI002603F1E0|nr:hypothetical protein [Ferrimicrobium sp.]
MPQRRAISLETVVREERGQWVVMAYAIYESEIVGKRCGVFRRQREAERAAAWLQQAAHRW